jgi:ATP/maltotriose-dependent transcriptional regulator MalT
MRDDIKKRILEEIDKGNHIFLKGKHGIGKSFLAQEIASQRKRKKSEIWWYSPFCKPPKQILLQAIETILKKGKEDKQWKTIKRGTIVELSQTISDLLKKSHRKLILVLDELHTISGNAATSYHLLMQYTKDVIFFTLGTTPYLENKTLKPEMKRFFWELKEIEMPSLNPKETEELLDEFLDLNELDHQKLDVVLRKKILKNSSGNALAIRKAVEQIAKNEEPEIAGQGVVRNEAINLFPIFIFMVFIIIGLKYLYRGAGDYELANFSGFIGIILFFLIRFLWSGRRKN